MLKISRQLLLVIVLTVALSSCSNAAEKSEVKPTATRKGAQAMKTYHMGRFAIDVPADFKLEVQSQELRYATVSDFTWEAGDRDIKRETFWAERLAEIKNLHVPVDKSALLIEERKVPSAGIWTKGIMYRGDYLNPSRIFWTVLVDYGETGVCLTIIGINKEKMIKNVTNILTHYESGMNGGFKESFFLSHGRISLPYLEQERTYARFQGPMGMVLKVEMHEIHYSPEKEGIVDRTVAAIATGFAAGLDITKIRSRKKTIAGLRGEEEILQGDDGKHKNVSFDWEFLGSVESGEEPMIQITIDTKAEYLQEKIAIWDEILDSFRPTY